MNEYISLWLFYILKYNWLGINNNKKEYYFVIRIVLYLLINNFIFNKDYYNMLKSAL